jgi:glycosyltransferase involved in cell wall biosynthesis
VALAVIIPCLNEEVSIAKTIAKIKLVRNESNIIVIDNGSTDKTVEEAIKAGAKVLREPKRGKGYAIRRGLNSLPKNTDAVFMVDGDNTYDVSKLQEAFDLVSIRGYDLVIGVRKTQDNSILESKEFRFGHNLGNKFLTKLFKLLFKIQISDTLSGWRVMSKGFVDSFPGGDSEFEIEAEINAHAHTINASVVEIPVNYFARDLASQSKLRTYRDGWAILRRNLRLYKSEKPTIAYNLLALPWFTASVVLIWIVLSDYFQSGLVPRFPSLIAGVGSFIIACNLWVTGMILEKVRLQRVALARFVYMSSNRELISSQSNN